MNATAEQIGTDLYCRTIKFDYNGDHGKLMEEVWSGTPWMEDVYEGPARGDRRIDMTQWCEDRFGRECWPIHGHPGNWHRGGVTIDGWTWYGFKTKEMLQEFLAAWPTPEGVKHP